MMEAIDHEEQKQNEQIKIDFMRALNELEVQAKAYEAAINSQSQH